MSLRLSTRRALPAAAMTAAAGAVLTIAALGGGPATASAASAGDTPPPSAPAAAHDVAAGSDAAAPNSVTEKGHAVSGVGAAGGYTAHVNLYENSTYGTYPDVAVEAPDGSVLVRDPDVAPPSGLFRDGVIDATIPMVQRDEEHGSTPAGSVRVSGTYTLSGEPTAVRETLRDNGYIVVTRGSKTALSVDLSVQIGDVTIPVSVDEAFAFDNVTLRQPIGRS